MKRILIVAVIGLGVVGGIYGLSNFGSTTTADNVSATSTPEVIEVMTPEEKMEEATRELIAAAIAASSTEIQAAAQAEADRVVTSMEAKIEKRVRQELINSNDAVIIEIEGKQSF